MDFFHIERHMIIQVNTDKNVTGGEELTANVEQTVQHAVQFVAQQITRIEVHVSDENGEGKAGPADKQCRIEARLAGRQPILVSHEAATVDQAVNGAAGKLKRALNTILGKLETH